MASRTFSSAHRNIISQVVTETVGGVATVAQEAILRSLFEASEQGSGAKGESALEEAVQRRVFSNLAKDTERNFNRTFPVAIRNIIMGKTRSSGGVSNSQALDVVIGRTPNDEAITASPSGADAQASREYAKEYKKALQRYNKTFQLSWMAIRIRGWLEEHGYRSTRDYWKRSSSSLKSRIPGYQKVMSQANRFGFQTGGVARYYASKTRGKVDMKWRNVEGNVQSSMAIRRRVNANINRSIRKASAYSDSISKREAFTQSFGTFGRRAPDVNVGATIEFQPGSDISMQMMHRRFSRRRGGFPLYNRLLAESALQISIVRAAIKSLESE